LARPLIIARGDDLAAALAFAVRENRPFVDRDKRATFGAGRDARPGRIRTDSMGEAAETLSEDEFRKWVADRACPITLEDG